MNKARKSNVVIEGLYDAKVFNALKNAFKEHLFTINLAATRHARKRRLMFRKEIPEKQAKLRLRKGDEIKWQAGMLQTIKKSDFTIRTIYKVPETINLIKQRIHKLRRL